MHCEGRKWMEGLDTYSVEVNCNIALGVNDSLLAAQLDNLSNHANSPASERIEISRADSWGGDCFGHDESNRGDSRKVRLGAMLVVLCQVENGSAWVGDGGDSKRGGGTRFLKKVASRKHVTKQVSSILGLTKHVSCNELGI